MDLKPFYILISILAVGAGVVVGWIDAQDARAGRGDPSISEPETPGAEEHRGDEDEPDEREDSNEPEDDDPSRHEVVEVVKPSGPTAAELDSLRNIEEQIRRLDFESALEEASRLAASESDEVKRDAARLEAKAFVHQSLLPPKGKPSASKGGLAYEILLSNQRKLIASSVEREGSKYVIQLEGKSIKYSPSIEDVLDIKEIERKALTPAQRRAKIATLRDASSAALAQYNDVVVAYCKEGYDQDGYKVLVEILAQEDAEELITAYKGKDADQLAAMWKRLHAKEAAPEIARRDDPATRRETTKPRKTKPRVVKRDPEPDPDPDPPPPTVKKLSAKEKRALLRKVYRLLGEATAAYRNAVGQDGRGREIAQARKKAQSALDLLEQVPRSDEEAREVRLDLQRLIQEIHRASTFGN
ncbi:MAG: hypothetical protein AAF517_11160 [Planctomycetota bacterium]